MKMQALRTFMLKDEKTGKLLTVKSGDPFDLDVDIKEQAEIAYQSLGTHAIIVDTHFIPPEGRYRFKHPFQISNADGTIRTFKPGKEEYLLDQATACLAMAKGFAEPCNEKAWRPAFLINGASISEKPPKALFDVEEQPQKESWVRKGMR